MMQALAAAKKQGKARFTGFSSHDRHHIEWMIRTYPEVVDVIVTPYTSNTKVVTDEHGLWATMKKLDVGWFGIKPFNTGRKTNENFIELLRDITLPASRTSVFASLRNSSLCSNPGSSPK